MMRLPYNFPMQSTFKRRRFEDAHCCRPHSYNPLCVVDLVCGSRRNGETLRMHSVPGDVLRANRKESSRSHMERHEGMWNLIQDLAGEMQASRRRCYRAWLPRKNRLVTRNIPFIAEPIDVRRQ